MLTTCARPWDAWGSAACCPPSGQAEGRCHLSYWLHRCRLSASANAPTSPQPARVLLNDLIVPRVNTTRTIRKRCVRGDPLRCRRPTDAPVCLTPRGIAVPIRVVTIEGGWGWAISAPTARVCEIDPNTVLQWLVEAAEPLQAFSASCTRASATTRRVVCRAAQRQGWREQCRQRHQVPGAFAPLGVDGARPGEPTAVGDRERTTPPGEGTTCGASRGRRVSARVCARLVARWLQGVSARHGGPLWLVGSPRAQPRQRPLAPAPLDAVAWAAGGAGGAIFPSPAPCGRHALCGVRYTGGRRAGLSGLRLEDQHGLCGEAPPGEPSARGSGGTSCHHAVPGRRRHAAAAGLVPRLSPCRGAPCKLAPAVAGSRAHPGPGPGPALAAGYASAGGRSDRPWVDAARRAALSRATVATTLGGVRGERRG